MRADKEQMARDRDQPPDFSLLLLSELLGKLNRQDPHLSDRLHTLG
jgi:hypothetical protein